MRPTDTRALVIAGAMIAASGLAQAYLQQLDRPADLILSGGHVRTSSGWALALAVRRGVIVAVGDAKSVEAFRGPQTETIELAGATVLPGLHDLHVHPMYAGIMERRCRIAQGSNLQETLKGVKDCADRAAPGDWVVGGQWDAPALGGVPNRATLDPVSSDRAVYLE